MGGGVKGGVLTFVTATEEIGLLGSNLPGGDVTARLLGTGGTCSSRGGRKAWNPGSFIID